MNDATTQPEDSTPLPHGLLDCESWTYNLGGKLLKFTIWVHDPNDPNLKVREARAHGAKVCGVICIESEPDVPAYFWSASGSNPRIDLRIIPKVGHRLTAVRRMQLAQMVVDYINRLAESKPDLVKELLAPRRRDLGLSDADTFRAKTTGLVLGSRHR